MIYIFSIFSMPRHHFMTQLQVLLCKIGLTCLSFNNNNSYGKSRNLIIILLSIPTITNVVIFNILFNCKMGELHKMLCCVLTLQHPG